MRKLVLIILTLSVFFGAVPVTAETTEQDFSVGKDHLTAVASAVVQLKKQLEEEEKIAEEASQSNLLRDKVNEEEIAKIIADFFNFHGFSKKGSSDGRSHLQIRFYSDAKSDLEKYRYILSEMSITADCIDIDLTVPEARDVFRRNLVSLKMCQTRDYVIAEVIKKFQIAMYSFCILGLLGIVAAVFAISVNKVIGIFLVTYVIWVLCCISLVITLKLTISEWKRIQHGR